MFLFISLAVLLIISFLWALHSLKKELAKPKKEHVIYEGEHHEKVLFESRD